MAGPRYFRLPIICLASLLSVACAQDIPGLERRSGESKIQLEALFNPVPSLIQPALPSVTVASGTHVLMSLTSPLHSTSGVEGSGVYLETLQPVVQGDHIVIPAHTQVQGVVEANKRPGHFQRTAEFRFHFTNLIFPNNHVVQISGVLLGIPGSSRVRLHRKDGKLKTVDQTERVVAAAIVGATGGGVLGSVSRLGIGKYAGAGLGAGLGLEATLLQRGDEIMLGRGTPMEMVLDQPFVLEPEQAAFNADYIAPRSDPSTYSGEARGRDVKRRERRPGLFPGVVPWR